MVSFCETIMWQFPHRRKPEEFVIYKEDSEGCVMIQSDKTVAVINMETHKGMLNAKGSNNKYFVHLNPMLGAVPYNFPVELITMLEAKKPRKGELIGTSEITGPIFWG